MPVGWCCKNCNSSSEQRQPARAPLIDSSCHVFPESGTAAVWWTKQLHQNDAIGTVVKRVVALAVHYSYTTSKAAFWSFFVEETTHTHCYLLLWCWCTTLHATITEVERYWYTGMHRSKQCTALLQCDGYWSVDRSKHSCDERRCSQQYTTLLAELGIINLHTHIIDNKTCAYPCDRYVVCSDAGMPQL